MSRRLKSRLALVGAGIGMLLIYQNCAQTPDNSTLNSQSSFVETLPFAYKSTIDTLAYMSCSDITDTSIEPRAYFTFRAGAYSSATGGVAISKAFLNATQFFSQEERGRAIAGSDYNHNTLLSLSIRSASNYQALWHTDQIVPGEALDSFLPALDSDQIAGPLSSEPVLSGTGDGQQINYFPGTEDKRLMEASLRFLKYENVASDTRNTLESRASYLVMGYTKTADIMDQNLRSPLDVTLPASSTTPARPASQTASNSVFGTAYLLHFDFPVGYAAGERRVLSASSPVQEQDLTTNQSQAANWDCSNNYEFMVVRPEDKALGTVICNAGVDRFANGSQQAALNAIRRVLRVEDWFVDLDHHCVMPKRTGDYCYGANLGTRKIQYGQNSCANTATTSCPHFVSVCLRN